MTDGEQTAAQTSGPDATEADRQSPHGHGIDPAQLEEDDLLQELESLHRTRHETFLHGSDDALEHHTRRTGDLEQEYLRRHPQRSVEQGRTRDGARAR